AQQLHVLLADPGCAEGQARDVSTRSSQARNVPGREQIWRHDRDDGNRRRRSMGGLDFTWSGHDDDVDLELDELVRETRKALGLAAGEGPLDRDVPAFGVAETAERFNERRPLGPGPRRIRADRYETDARHLRRRLGRRRSRERNEQESNDQAEAPRAHRETTSASRFAYSSTVAVTPGGITVVDSRSSTMAGPASEVPGGSAYRAYGGVSA